MSVITTNQITVTQWQTQQSVMTPSIPMQENEFEMGFSAPTDYRHTDCAGIIAREIRTS